MLKNVPADVVGLAGVLADVRVVGTETVGTEEVGTSTGVLDGGLPGAVVDAGGFGGEVEVIGVESGWAGPLGVGEGVGVGVGVCSGGDEGGAPDEVTVTSTVVSVTAVVVTTDEPLELSGDCLRANRTKLVATSAFCLWRASNADLSCWYTPCLYLSLKCSWRISWRVAASRASRSSRNC